MSRQPRPLFVQFPLRTNALAAGASLANTPSLWDSARGKLIEPRGRPAMGQAQAIGGDDVLSATWRAETPTRSSSGGTARDPSSSPPIAEPTSGSPPSTTRSAPKAPSTASPTTPLTSSLTASPTEAASSRPSLRRQHPKRRRAPREGTCGPCRAHGKRGRRRSTARTYPSTLPTSPSKTGQRKPVSHSAHRPRRTRFSTHERRTCLDPQTGLEHCVTRRDPGGIPSEKPGSHTPEKRHSRLGRLGRLSLIRELLSRRPQGRRNAASSIGVCLEQRTGRVDFGLVKALSGALSEEESA